MVVSYNTVSPADTTIMGGRMVWTPAIFACMNAAFFSLACVIANADHEKLSFVFGSQQRVRNALFAIYSAACLFSAVSMLLPYPFYLVPLLAYHAVVILIIPTTARSTNPANRLNVQQSAC